MSLSPERRHEIFRQHFDAVIRSGMPREQAQEHADGMVAIAERAVANANPLTPGQQDAIHRFKGNAK